MMRERRGCQGNHRRESKRKNKQGSSFHRCLLSFLCRFFPVLGTCRRQGKLQTDIAFVARVLDELFLIREFPHYKLDAKGLGAPSGVIAGISEKQVVCIEQLVPSREMPPRAVRARKIRVFNDQCVAFPMPARRPQLEMYICWGPWTRVHINHL